MARLYQRDGRERVRSYSTYEEAQRAVDHLSDVRFPVEQLSIVAEDLQFVEDITGRRDLATAAYQGLASGALVGGLIGFFFGLFSLVDPLVSALALAFYGVLFGGLVGTLFGLTTHWLSKGRRDFSSNRSIQAANYHLVADAQVAGDAARLLDESPVARRQTAGAGGGDSP